MPRKASHSPVKHPTAEDLQNALKGLRALSLVEIYAHPLDDGQSPEELFQRFGNDWLAILSGKYSSQMIPLDETDETGLPDRSLGSVLKTGVRVVAISSGRFYTEYHVPGNLNAIRKSTKIPLDGIYPPIDAKGNWDVKLNPLWWWKSPRRLEIISWIKRAILERFEEHSDFMIQAQAEKAVLEAWPYIERCVADVARLLGDYTKAFDECNAIFREYGIDLLVVETFAEGSDPTSHPSREQFRPFRQIAPASSEEIHEAFEATKQVVARIDSSRNTRFARLNRGSKSD